MGEITPEQKAALTAPIEPDKQCMQCLKFKELSAFHKHPMGKMGRQPYCKDCQREKNRARYLRKKATQTLLE